VEGEAEREEGEQCEEVSPVLVGRPLLCRQCSQRLQHEQTHFNWKQCDESVFIESGSQAFWRIRVWIQIQVFDDKNLTSYTFEKKYLIFNQLKTFYLFIGIYITVKKTILKSSLLRQIAPLE
jgi:hypothetical protein